MAEDIEKMTINKCPKCSQQHRYNIKVRRSWFIKMLTAQDLYERSEPVRVTRLFTCPVNNEDFQARFVLYQISGSKIEAVEVMGAEASTDE